MAPAFTPGRKKRENQFFEVGVQGRKTGITLKDTGVRDEYGMEPLEGIFSSPEKSPHKRITRNGNNTLSSEEMAIAHSSAPEPAEVLTGRRSAKTVFPPPLGRSPIKTAIGSSPRRQSSVGPLSPARTLARSPLRNGRAESHPAVARKLDFSAQDEPILKSVEVSPERNLGRRGRSAGKPHRDIFAPLSSDHNGDQFASAPIPEEPEPQINGFHHSSPLPVQQDDSLQLLDQDSEINDVVYSVEEQAHSPPNPDQTSPSGAESRLKADSNLHARGKNIRDLQPSRRDSELDRVLRQATDDSARDEAYQPEPSPDVEVEAVEPSPQRPVTKRKPGRPRKSDSVIVHEDSAPPLRPQGTKRKALKPAPADRGPNAKIVAAKRQKSDTDSVVGRAGSAQENRRPGPRSLQILRQGTPADEEGTRTTRFGRASVKPVAWWCGERVDRDYDGTIKNIVRAQSVEPAKRARAASRKPQRAKPDMSVVEEEDEEDIEDWELDPGVVSGQVRAWDPDQGIGVEEPDNEMDLAFAANAIETRDVAGANFKYSKVLSLSFFGSGLVDIPPNGFKSAKNSRKMEMVFMVHMGKVCVRVEDTEFTISKGGVWRVPRGNTYSIQNWSKSAARIFFAQACEVAPEYDEE